MICHRLPVRTLTSSCSSARAAKTPCAPISFTLPIRQKSTLTVRRTTSPLSRPNVSTTRAAQSTLRSAASRSYATATIDASAGKTVAGGASGEQQLTWNRFLQLRKVRRRISLLSSIVGAGITFSGSIYVLSTSDVEKLAAQYIGLDPLISMGLIVIATGASGWLIGPFFGNAVFNLSYRGLRKPILQKEKEFFNRIKKNRVDPSSSSVQNPVPDYYGEKIGSVQGYRRWLKDQRAFNLKRAGSV